MSPELALGLGVLGGFLASSATTYFGSWLTERAARKAEERRLKQQRVEDHRRATAAATLVVAELAIVHRSLERAYDNTKWKTSLPLPTGVWEENASLLLRWLDEDAAQSIVFLMANLANYHAEMDEYMDGKEEQELFSSMHKSTRLLRDEVQEALDRLVTLASEDPLDQQWEPLTGAEEDELIEATDRADDARGSI